MYILPHTQNVVFIHSPSPAAVSTNFSFLYQESGQGQAWCDTSKSSPPLSVMPNDPAQTPRREVDESMFCRGRKVYI